MTLSSRSARACPSLLALVVSCVLVCRDAAALEVDLTGYAADCGVSVRVDGDAIDLAWSAGGARTAALRLDISGDAPLIAELGLDGAPALAGFEPAFWLTVGSRVKPSGKPDDQKWAVFFDNPQRRPFERFLGELSLESARVVSAGRRATVDLATLRAGPFTGSVELTAYVGSPLVRVEAVVVTSEDMKAITYDAGLLAGDGAALTRDVGWLAAVDGARRNAGGLGDPDRALAVRHRMLAVSGAGAKGAVACLPPPHQFFFPRDWSDNLATVWLGRGHLDSTERAGFGVRQPETGGGPFVPWFNGVPGERHRLSFFLWLADDVDAALSGALRLTRGDRFERLPGHLTFTSHYHMAISVAAMDRKKRGLPPLAEPDFVRMFKDMGVDMVHLGEFHGDGHQKGPAPVRLPELDAMFEECRRLSDAELLLIPGEELNTFLGLAQPGKHPGHWMSLFPKPVSWVAQRNEGEPFVVDDAERGRVYRVGSREDMVRLLDAEAGFAWAAHPRIKASSWTPDIFRREDFYLSNHWLGGAWKAMPGDLSQPRLGERPLALLDDMANWASWRPDQELPGERKYLLGEVDVFKLERSHELWGHMNINYLRLDRLPRFDDGWQSVIDALRRGAFFVTTGEIVLREFTVGGRASGETLVVEDGDAIELTVAFDWTFPLAFAEVVAGDGERVTRERIDLAATEAFGRRRLELQPALEGKRWVRFEVWDVAANGAFTQPVWLARQ